MKIANRIFLLFIVIVNLGGSSGKVAALSPEECKASVIGQIGYELILQKRHSAYADVRTVIENTDVKEYMPDAYLLDCLKDISTGEISEGEFQYVCRNIGNQMEDIAIAFASKERLCLKKNLPSEESKAFVSKFVENMDFYNLEQGRILSFYVVACDLKNAVAIEQFYSNVGSVICSAIFNGLLHTFGAIREALVDVIFR